MILGVIAAGAFLIAPIAEAATASAVVYGVYCGIGAIGSAIAIDKAETRITRKYGLG